MNPTTMTDEMEKRIQLLITYLDTCIADSEREERRCTEAGKPASAALWEGNRTGFFIARKAVLRLLLDLKPEVQ